jgi:hypothetical protein
VRLPGAPSWNHPPIRDLQSRALSRHGGEQRLLVLDRALPQVFDGPGWDAAARQAEQPPSSHRSTGRADGTSPSLAAASTSSRSPTPSVCSWGSATRTCSGSLRKRSCATSGKDRPHCQPRRPVCGQGGLPQAVTARDSAGRARSLGTTTTSSTHDAGYAPWARPSAMAVVGTVHGMISVAGVGGDSGAGCPRVSPTRPSVRCVSSTVVST